MKTTRDFQSVDRYYFDCGLCNPSKGWAQIDSWQDASYFGTWANPFDLKVFSYTEGDLCLVACDTPEEFRAYLDEVNEWNEKNGEKRYDNGKAIGIDPMLHDEIEARFREIGCAEYLH